MSLTSRVSFVILWLFRSLCVVFGEDSGEDSFKDCLIDKPTEGLGYCLGVGALTKLRSLENDLEFNIADGVIFSRDEQQYREAYSFVDSDPGNLRTVVDFFDHVFSKRNLLWDMSYIYPGLSMRVAPSFSSDGVLEFALDQHRESINQQYLKEVGTGRLLARQYLVPLLLGFKFKLASLLPIIFGAVALFISKVAIISKLALVISSAYALSGLVFTSGSSCPENHYQPVFNPSFGGHYNVRYKDEEPVDSYLRSKNVYRDRLHLHGNIPVEEVFVREEKPIIGRNFAWSDDENKKKS